MAAVSPYRPTSSQRALGPLQAAVHNFGVAFRHRVRWLTILNFFVDAALCVSIGYARTEFSSNDRLNAETPTFHVTFTNFLPVKLSYSWLVNFPYSLYILWLGQSVPNHDRKKVYGWLLLQLINCGIAGIGLKIFDEARRLAGGVSFDSKAPFSDEYKALWLMPPLVYLITIVYTVTLSLRPLAILFEIWQLRRVNIQFFIVRSPNEAVPLPL